MAIDIQNAPFTYIDNGNINAPRVPRRIDTSKANPEFRNRTGPEVYWNQMEKLANTTVTNIKKKYQDNERISEFQIDQVADLFFGPFRMEQSALHAVYAARRDQEVSDEDLDFKSRIQANMTHAIIYATNPDVNEQYAGSIYDIAAYFENISSDKNNPAFNPDVRRFWDEIKSRVAVIRTLRKYGFTIQLPNYTKDPFEPDSGENEVVTWARAGVDFIAQKDDQAYLVNTSGEEFHNIQKSGGYRIERSHEEVSFEADLYGSKTQWAERARAQLPKSITNYFDQTFPKSVRKARVTVPLASSYLSSLPPSAQISGRGKSELSRFCRFDEQVEKGLVSEFLLSNLKTKLPFAA